jgi:hypothetical protein
MTFTLCDGQIPSASSGQALQLRLRMTGKPPSAERNGGEMKIKIWISLKKQRQTPAFGWKSESLSTKSETGRKDGKLFSVI